MKIWTILNGFYNEIVAELGLDKPLFYFSIRSAAYSDTIHLIANRFHRKNLTLLTAQYGNWEQIELYYQQIEQFQRAVSQLPDSISWKTKRNLRNYQELFNNHKNVKIRSHLDKLASALETDSMANALLSDHYSNLSKSYQSILENATPSQLYIPAFRWYGLDNQYHRWISDFVQGDFGNSYVDGRPVATKMKEALFWTLLINGSAIFLAYLLSIPIGVQSAIERGSFFDRGTSLLLFMLYSLPTFWIATLLVIFFTNSEYGMDWFPTHGLGDWSIEMSFWERFLDLSYHMILPVFCLTYGSLAFLSRQMRGGMIDALNQDYVRTAWAKGLNKGTVVWKHAFRNALFPIITLFASVFPAVLAGAIIIEVIFGIPGMGRLSIQAIKSSDWPVVYTILMLGAVLTMIGILVADILYRLADPRVEFNKK